jgi:hypothetical protein
MTETLSLIAEKRISVFTHHPAYVEAFAEVGIGEVPKRFKRRAYWHDHATGAEAIASVVGEVAREMEGAAAALAR